MLIAKDIIELVPKGGSLVLCFTLTKDGMAVMVTPKPVIKIPSDLSGAKEAIEAAMQPKVVRGTAEELDSNFMELLKQMSSAQNTVVKTLSEVDAATKEAIERIKKEGASKVEAAGKTASLKAKTTAKPAVTDIVAQAALEMPAAPKTTEELEEEGEEGEPPEGAETQETKPVLAQTSLF